MSQELNWDTTYGINFDDNYKLDFITLNRLEEFINKLSNKIDDKNVENKIDQIEKDYQNKLKDVEILCKDQTSIDELKQKNSLVILQKELEIIKLLTKYTLQNKNLDYNFFLNCLNILLGLSETLRIRLGQKEINHDKQNEQKDENKDEFIISRCSYKFCSYKDSCSYNYTKAKNLCYQDHYVHNMVSADLNILINYINFKKIKTENLVLHNKEILKTINTLSFVIGHMELELRTKCLYLPENAWETCHVVKNK
jgi:hypothetical protein